MPKKLYVVEAIPRTATGKISTSRDILEEQRNRGIGGQVLRVLREIGKQQQRAAIHVAGSGNQRDIGAAGEAGRQYREQDGCTTCRNHGALRSRALISQ